MVLVSFFEITYGDRLSKNDLKLRVQVIPRSTVKGRVFLNFQLDETLAIERWVVI